MTDFNQVDIAATIQKMYNFYGELFDAVIHLPDNRQIIEIDLQQKIFLLMTICLVKLTLKMTIS